MEAEVAPHGHDFLAGGGEMGARMRAHDWRATSLGDPGTWPQSLRTAVRLMLNTGHPIYIFWGADGACLYNDAYRPSLGPERHPGSLGRPAREVWDEIWPIIGPQLDQVLSGRGATWDVNALIPMTRQGVREDVYWTYSYSPIDNESAPGGIGGVLTICTETTGQVRNAQRLAESEERLAADLAGMRRLYDLHTRLAHETDLTAALREILRAAAEFTGTDRGTVQLVSEDGARLEIVANHGYAPGSRFVEHFRRDGFEAGCDATRRQRQRLVIEDTRTFSGLVGTADGEAALADGVLAAQSTPMITRGGEMVGVLSTQFSHPHRPGDDELRLVDMLAWTAADFVERRRAETALRGSEERFRQFGEASADTLWIVDASTGRLEYLSPAFEAMWGEPRGGVMADISRWAGFLHPDDREAAMSGLPRLLSGERFTNEYRIIRADGQVRWIEDVGFPVRDDAGRVVRVAGIAQDLTERRVAEDRLRTLMEGIPQLVWRSRDCGLWTWSSPQWQAFTGQSEAESHALGWLGAIHPNDREASMRAWELVGQRGLLDMEHRVRRAADGAWLWHHTRAAPVRNADGRVLEWIGTTADVEEMVHAREVLARGREELEALVAARTAELMAAEEALRQAQKMEAVGQLTGGIAHDFNNMLQGVTGGLDMARRRVVEGRAEEALRYLGAVQEAAGRAAGLTRRLLAFARRQQLDPKPVSADELVAGLADLVRRTVGPGIGVELRLHDGGGSVLCDPNELESALLNLCINARDAMPNGGRLAMGTEWVHLSAADILNGDAKPGHYVAILVADTGTGIPPEVLGRVFEPFYTTKPQGQGTGLGLSQVYGFVRQSDGLVRIESTPGQGTTVRLLLPLHERVEAAEEPNATPLPPEAGVRRTVLLVDDEDAVRGPAGDRLRELGHVVREARDGPEALRILASIRPDLLVTDVGLPNGMNGRQVAEAARERRPGLPVLFITGYAGAVLPPGVEVIGKPFELDVLARRVQAILGVGRRDGDTNRGAERAVLHKSCNDPWNKDPSNGEADGV